MTPRNRISFRSFFSLVAILSMGLFCYPGCAHKVKLDPAGAYHGDTYLYQADLAITSSYSVLDTFVNWEYANRPLLSGIPGPTRLADDIRMNAKQWFSSARALREAYAASPIPQNKVALQKILAVIQAALIQAAGYMAIPPPAPTSIHPA